MSYKQSIYIPFHFGDPAGILFYGHVFSIAHEVLENFVREELKIDWSHWFNHPDWIVPIRDAKAEYLKPIYVGQICNVDINVESIGNSSICFAYNFMQNQSLCCTVKTVHVFCSKSTGIKRSIPDSVRIALQL